MKRRVSFVLALVMLLSMLPFAVWAQEDPITVASVVDAEVTAEGYTVEYTAESAGTLNVTVGTCSPGWRYRIYSPDGTESIYRTKWSAGTSCDYYYQTAGNWKVVFYAYSSAEADNVAGAVSFDVTFTPDSGTQQVQKVEYEIADTQLNLGDNAVSLLETAYTTIYEFEPSKMGVYTFTAPQGAKVGYWGAGSWFLMDPGSETNTCEWTCTGVGQSAFVGVSGVEGDFNLNVAKTGDYTPVQIIEQKYENKATLAPFTVPDGAKLGSYVDVMDKAVTHTAVLGDDGYYHLDSADGDVLIVDFNYADIILSAALKSDRPVMNAYVTAENGDTIKYDIGDAILAYEEVMDGNGYYPVTEDIILFYQVYAVGAGTFTYHLTGMNYNEDCVWMYCMRTMNMDNVVEPEPEQPTEPSEPETQPTVPTTPSEPTEPEVDPSEPEVEPTKPTPTEPVAGEVVLNENVTASSGSKFVQSYTPAEDGTIYVTVGDGSAKWKSDLRSVVGLTFTTLATAEGTTQQTYSAQVTGGIKYQVRVWDAADKALTETPLMIVFVPAAGAEPEQPTEPSEPETEPTVPSEPSEPSEPETEPTVPSEPETEPTTPAGPSANGTLVVTNEEVTAAGYTYTYHAATAGTLNVTVGDCAPGWRYKVYSPDGVESLYRTKYSAGTSCDYTNVAGDWKIVFYAYSSAEADNVAGTVSFTITFTPDASEPEVPTEPSEPETEPTVPSEPETQPTEPSEPETQPTEPAPTEPTPSEPALPDIPVIDDADVPAGTYYAIVVDGNTNYYSSSTGSALNTALKAIKGSGYVKFYQNMSLGSSYTIDVYNGDIVLDLNGCTITSAYKAAGTLYVDGGKVTLIDSSAEGDGLLTNSSTGFGMEIYGGSVTMLGGNAQGVQGAKVWKSASLEMKGGVVTGTSYGINALAESTVTISGGEVVQGATGSFKYALYAASTATMSVTGGKFNGTVSGSGLSGKISGGYFSTGFSDTYLATDCTMESNVDATYLWVVVDPNAVTPEEPVQTPVVAVYAKGAEIAQYTTIADAMAACTAGQYLVLIDNVTEDVTVTGELYLDLNGKTLTGAVLGNGTLYAMDSATNDYNDDDMGGIVGNVMCNVPAQIETDITGEMMKYLAVSGRNGMTFHRFYVGITAVTLNPAKTGFGYKAEFYGDATVQAMVENIGYDLWVIDAKVVSSTAAFKNVLTLRLSNFLVEEFGEAPVNAQVFMTLNNGVKLVSSVQSYSMRDALEDVNDNWSGYTEAQKSAVKEMCNKFYDVVSLWDLDNIFSIINIPIN